MLELTAIASAAIAWRVRLERRIENFAAVSKRHSVLTRLTHRLGRSVDRPAPTRGIGPPKQLYPAISSSP
jgi:hypothetical protein